MFLGFRLRLRHRSIKNHSIPLLLKEGLGLTGMLTGITPQEWEDHIGDQGFAPGGNDDDK